MRTHSVRRVASEEKPFEIWTVRLDCDASRLYAAYRDLPTATKTAARLCELGLRAEVRYAPKRAAS